MITRLFSLVLILLLTGSVGLYLLKYEVKSIEQELAETERHIQKTKERLTVLKAEWSFLNRPERIEALTRKHLDLSPSHGETIQALSTIPNRFPDRSASHGFASLPEDAQKTPIPSLAPAVVPTPDTDLKNSAQ